MSSSRSWDVGGVNLLETLDYGWRISGGLSMIGNLLMRKRSSGYLNTGHYKIASIP